MTTLKNIVAAVAIATTALTTLGATAQAGDYGRGYGYGHRPHYGYGGGHGGYGGYGGYGHRAPAPQPYYHEPRRDRTGEKIAKGVAIGVGALILGSILANEARRNRHHRY